MIRDLSLTLQAILDDPALSTGFADLLAAQVVFDRPVEAFNPAVPTLNLFLFDVRENLELRSNEPQVSLANGEYTIVPPLLRVSCSYLVTAWPAGGMELPLQEHHLLSQALQVLARYNPIPSRFLKGGLVGQEPPLPMLTAKSEAFKEPHEFWAAIGNKLRASFVVTATVGLDVTTNPIHAPEVIASAVRLDRRASPGSEELVLGAGPARFRIGGRVTDSASALVADANVQIVQLGLTARTDGEGRYQIGAMRAGNYTLRVTKGAASAELAVVVPPGPNTTYDVRL